MDGRGYLAVKKIKINYILYWEKVKTCNVLIIMQIFLALMLVLCTLYHGV